MGHPGSATVNQPRYRAWIENGDGDTVEDLIDTAEWPTDDEAWGPWKRDTLADSSESVSVSGYFQLCLLACLRVNE